MLHYTSYSSKNISFFLFQFRDIFTINDNNKKKLTKKRWYKNFFKKYNTQVQKYRNKIL